MEDHERDAMIDSMRCRREEPTEYTAPGVAQRWRARDLVDIHWKLTGIEIPSESYNRRMSCIIGHANPDTGRCQVKQKLLATETGYSVDTVKRAVRWWGAEGFLKKQDMGRARSNAYHPQWDLFEILWIAIAKDIEEQKTVWRGIKGNHAEGIKGHHDGAHHAALHESQNRTSKDESHPEWAHPPSAADALVYFPKGKKGLQRKRVDRASPSLQTLALSAGSRLGKRQRWR